MNRRTHSDRDGTAVLISGGEHLGVLAAVRALRAAGHRPWVAVHERGGYAARSRATAGVIEVPNPAVDETGFVRALAEASLRIPASVVLPGTEVGLLALAHHPHCFSPTVALGVCPASVVNKATDKVQFEQLARAAGLEVPPTVNVGLADPPSTNGLSYPLVVKPPRSELKTTAGGSHHFVPRRVQSPEELRAVLAQFPGTRGLVQPYLPGPLGSVAGVFWEGQMICAVQSRADRIWPPHCGSMTYAVTVPLDPHLSSSIGGLLRGIAWNGLFQIDFIEQSGAYYVIDLNPRIYTSLAITTGAGVNLLAIWVDLLRGRAVQGPHEYPAGVAYRHDEDDIRALLGMLIRGPRGAAIRGLLPRRRTVHTVFSIKDPWPVLTTLGKLLRIASARVR